MKPSNKSKTERLGKGLSMFFGDGEDESGSTENGGFKRVLLDEILPNPDQPRRYFDEVGLQELAQSIYTHGIIQPILVYFDEGKYHIIAGERRFRAAKLAGLTEVPITVTAKPTQHNLLELALLENIQRRNLTPIEEAMAYQALIEDFQSTHESVATSVGKSRAHISNMIRLLKLPNDVLRMVDDEKISTGHAKILVSVEDPYSWAQTVVQDNLSVRGLEKRIAEIVRAQQIDKEEAPAIGESPTTSIEEEILSAIISQKMEESNSLTEGKLNNLAKALQNSAVDQTDSFGEFSVEHRVNRPRVSADEFSSSAISSEERRAPSSQGGDLLSECYNLVNNLRNSGLNVNISDSDSGQNLLLNCDDEKQLYSILRLLYTMIAFKDE